LNSTDGIIGTRNFPKGTDLSLYSAEDLAVVAAELNDRPRKILDWKTPAELFGTLIATLT
jgi:transposase, IS30 family